MKDLSGMLIYILLFSFILFAMVIGIMHCSANSCVTSQYKYSINLCTDMCEEIDMNGQILVGGLCQCTSKELSCEPNKLGTIALECKEVK